MKRISLLSLVLGLSIPAHVVAMSDQPTLRQRVVAAFKQGAKKMGDSISLYLADQQVARMIPPSALLPGVARIFPASTMLSGPGLLAGYLYMSRKARDMSYFTSEEQRKFEDEQNQVQTFVRSELANYGFANAHTVPVYYTSIADGGYMIAESKGIGISRGAREDFIKAGIIHAPLYTASMTNSDGTREIIETWHNQTPEESQKIRDELRGVIHHEAGHLRNHDFITGGILATILPVTTYIASYKMINILNKRIPNMNIQALLIAGSAYPLYLTNTILCKAFRRYREARADENIPNDPQILKALISYFSKEREPEKEMIASGEIPDLDNNLWAYLFTTHPTLQQRLRRFQERLDALEKQNKMKEVL